LFSALRAAGERTNNNPKEEQTMNTTKPSNRIRRGRLEVAIWENTSKNGVFYRAKFSRSYRDGEGKLKNSDSFGSSELGDLAVLAIQAQDWMRSAERAKSADAEPAADGDTEAEAVEA
jgi:hypothetical protein